MGKGVYNSVITTEWRVTTNWQTLVYRWCVQVSFMPKIKKGSGRGHQWRMHPYWVRRTPSSAREFGTEESMAAIQENTRKDGWIVDEGDGEATRTHPYTGKATTYGWRCEPKLYSSRR